MLTGACISRAGLNRTTAYATATWVLASEFPDIDVAYYLRGSVEAFAHHRGWTHTFMAAPVAAALLLPFFFGLVSEEVGEHKRGPRGRGLAIAALIFMLALWGFRDFQHRRALAALNSVLYRGESAQSVAAYPYMINPYTWHGVVNTQGFYQTVEVNSRTGEMDDSDNGHTYYKPEETPITLAAKKTRLGQVYLDWAVYPMIETLPEANGGWEVRFYDLRYVYPGRSSTVLGGYVLLDKNLKVLEERMGKRQETENREMPVKIP